MSMFYLAKQAADRAEKERREEEAKNPRVLDKWKKAAPTVAGEAAGAAAGAATLYGTGSHTAASTAGRVVSKAVKDSVTKRGVSDNEARGLRDAAHALDQTAMAIAFPVYVPLKFAVQKLFGLKQD